ncbi:hypothetical protein CQW23_29066 [Capsicum baccatum]|uniref:Uncharacterized protein n=1 Tax=Capsicum baccatum TaxID=33114 RepID=A0A2G2VIF3_CAPBA|nr:hypothetical protein CQW23_29066 [Capsicum baccatum]
MATEQPKPVAEDVKMDLFENDDEFEEFAIDQEWEDKEEGKEVTQQWEDDWGGLQFENSYDIGVISKSVNAYCLVTIVVVKALNYGDIGNLEVVDSPLMIWLRIKVAFKAMQIVWKVEFLLYCLET